MPFLLGEPLFERHFNHAPEGGATVDGFFVGKKSDPFNDAVGKHGQQSKQVGRIHQRESICPNGGLVIIAPTGDNAFLAFHIGTD